MVTFILDEKEADDVIESVLRRAAHFHAMENEYRSGRDGEIGRYLSTLAEKLSAQSRQTNLQTSL